MSLTKLRGLLPYGLVITYYIIVHQVLNRRIHYRGILRISRYGLIFIDLTTSLVHFNGIQLLIGPCLVSNRVNMRVCHCILIGVNLTTTQIHLDWVQSLINTNRGGTFHWPTIIIT